LRCGQHPTPVAGKQLERRTHLEAVGGTLLHLVGLIPGL